MDISVLASGSSGNCIFVRTGSISLLVDVGVSCKYLCRELEKIAVSPASIDAVLLTHEHTDHIKGVGTFAKRFGTAVYANRATWYSGQRYLGKVDEAYRREFTTNQTFSIHKQVAVTPFAISHDAADPVGFRIEAEGKRLVVATDLGLVTQGVLHHLRGADALIIEANHDKYMLEQGPYPLYLKRRIAGKRGHLPNDITARLLGRIICERTRAVFLAHLSEVNNAPLLALNTVCSHLAEKGIKVGGEVDILVASRKQATPLISIAD